MTAQEQEWDDLHLAVRQFQNTTLAIKHSPKPVVVAPQGLALGGGCEVVLHGTRIHAAAEAYIGLVETGVGLIPAGGGTKEMIIRANERAEGEEDLDLFHALKPVFENIAMAKVSTSGEEARGLGYLRRADLVAMNLDRLVADAKQTALGLVRGEWRQTAPAPSEPSIRVLGQEFSAAAKLAVLHDAAAANIYRNTMHWSPANSATSWPAARSRRPSSSASNISSTSNAKPSSPSAANAKPRSASPTPSRPESLSGIERRHDRLLYPA